MSLTPEAMKHIEDMAKAGDLIEAPNAKFDAVLIPDDMKIETTEHLQKFKNRFRGSFKTDLISGFSEYVNKQLSKTCFVHSQKATAIAIFDLGTTEEPGHCKHDAEVSLSQTAAFTALNKFISERQSQLDLVVFLEDWSFTITAKAADDKEMDINEAISAVRSIDIEAITRAGSEVQAFSSTKSINEKIEAKSGWKPLPGWVVFTCVPYHGLDEHDFPMRIQLSPCRGEISFNMNVTNYDHILESVVEEFREKIVAEIDDEAEIFTGSFTTKRF